MFCLDWLQAGRATRGKPRLERPGRRSWPLLGLLACSRRCCKADVNQGRSAMRRGSGLFGPCGFFSRVSARVFNRTNGAADCCEPGIVTGTPVEYAAPATVLTPGVSPVLSGRRDLEIGRRTRFDRFVDGVVPGRSAGKGLKSSRRLGRRSGSPVGTAGGELPNSRPGFRRSHRASSYGQRKQDDRHDA